MFFFPKSDVFFCESRIKYFLYRSIKMYSLRFFSIAVNFVFVFLSSRAPAGNLSVSWEVPGFYPLGHRGPKLCVVVVMLL